MYTMVLLLTFEEHLTQLLFHFIQLLPSLGLIDHKVGITEFFSNNWVNLQEYAL